MPEGLKRASLSLDENDSSLIEIRVTDRRSWIHWSHAAVVLAEACYEVVLYDNLSSSKLHVEEMLADVAESDKSWRIVCLRYFNSVGAHESGLIGEDPNDIPNKLDALYRASRERKIAQAQCLRQ